MTAFAEADRAAVYRVIAERRDVREGFRPDPADDEAPTRIPAAAHRAPSVGLIQPGDFLVIRDRARRERVRDLAERQRLAYAATLSRPRQARFDRLKVEAILEVPVNVAVTCDPTRGGPNPLGRHVQPATAYYSTACAVQNLWLAARAEGLGVGWVSFFDEREPARELGLPGHLEVVAHLCAGLDRFPPAPVLALTGWAPPPLAWTVHTESYGRRSLPGGEHMHLIAETVAAIRPPDEAAMRAAREHHGRLTKPPGSLGVLEELSVRLAGIAGACPPPLPEPAAVAVFAADHGVHAQGVTPWPQEVTAQMVANFLAGGAVVNAFARQVGAEVGVVDVGVAADLPATPGLIPRKIARGTADMTREPAMAREQAVRAVEAGVEVARDLVAAGNRCLVTGDMGIANTTASAALVAAFTGRPPEEVTGHGTGIDDETHARKIAVVRAALARAARDLGAGGPRADAIAPPDAAGRGTAGDDRGDAAWAAGTGEDRSRAGGTGAGRTAVRVAGGDLAGAAGDTAAVLAGADPIDVLAQVGGLEHAAIAGFVLGAAAERVPVVLDGVIAGSAALVAVALAPDAREFCVAGHRSAEPGHAVALRHLALRPLVDLDLRLGEGTGALLALPLVQSAVRVLHEVATFDSAGVAHKDGSAGAANGDASAGAESGDGAAGAAPEAGGPGTG